MRALEFVSQRYNRRGEVKELREATSRFPCRDREVHAAQVRLEARSAHLGVSMAGRCQDRDPHAVTESVLIPVDTAPPLSAKMRSDVVELWVRSRRTATPRQGEALGRSSSHDKSHGLNV
jgi:hypothetical protein